MAVTVKENPDFDAFDYEPENAKRLWDETFQVGANSILAALKDNPAFGIHPGDDEAMVTLFTTVAWTSAPVSELMADIVETADAFEDKKQQAKVLCALLRKTAAEIEQALNL